jgi:hypothetical protein
MSTVVKYINPKSNARLDREIQEVVGFVNSFDRYDPSNLVQRAGFEILHALQWARGRRKTQPIEYLRKLKEKTL